MSFKKITNVKTFLSKKVANTCVFYTWENETRQDLKKEGNQARFLNENFLNCLSTLNNTEKRATPTPRIREVIQLSTFGHDFTFFSKLLVPTVLVIQQGSYLIVCFWPWYFILFKPHVTNNFWLFLYISTSMWSVLYFPLFKKFFRGH